MSDEYEPIENIPAIMISVDHQVSEGRIVRFSTGIAQAAPLSEINGLLDKLSAATDRQQAKCELEKAQGDLKREEKLYAQQMEDMARLDGQQQAEYERSGKRAPWAPERLTAAQQKDRENAEVSIKRRRDMIVALREHVAKVQAKASVHADSTANSH